MLLLTRVIKFSDISFFLKRNTGIPTKCCMLYFRSNRDKKRILKIIKTTWVGARTCSNREQLTLYNLCRFSCTDTTRYRKIVLEPAANRSAIPAEGIKLLASDLSVHVRTRSAIDMPINHGPPCYARIPCTTVKF